jgi:hypothetical protein
LTALIETKLNLDFMAKKVTSPKVASTASKVLRDGRTSSASKSVAGSALSQREKGGKKK